MKKCIGWCELNLVEFYNLYSLGRLNKGEQDEQIMQHV
jgi:hypothetical protein